MAAWDSMITQVPDAEEGGGLERILEAIAQAQSVADLDAPWRTHDAEQLAELPLTIRGITKAPSDYAGGLPWFLIVDAINETTGEAITFTTGSVNIVAQLVRTYTLGGFPCRARVVIPTKATRNGFFPPHLEYLARRQAPVDGNGAQG
jgi:hypothetical protein